MKRPFLFIAAGMLATLYVLQLVPVFYQLAIFAVVFFSCAFYFSVKKKLVNKKIFFVLLGVMLSCGVNFLNTYYFYIPVTSLADKAVTAYGYISDIPTQTSMGSYCYPFHVTSVEFQGNKYDRGFDTLVYSDKPIEDITQFENIIIKCIFRLPDTADEKDDFDTRAYLKSKGIYLTTTLKSRLLTYKTGTWDGNIFLKGAFDFKESIINSLYKFGVLSPQNAGVAAAIVTNSRAGVSRAQNQLFAKTGLSHVLSASGMHVGIISAIILFLLGRFKVKRKFALIITIIPVIFFSAVAGFSPSIIRAAVMFILMAAAFFIDESYDALNALFISCIVILLVNSFGVTDVGFILTVASTLGIILFYNKVYGALKIKREGRIFTAANYFIGIISLTFSATVLVIPFNMLIFGGISVISPISNILVVPVIFIIFILAFLAFVFSLVPPLGTFFAMLLNSLMEYMNFVMNTLANSGFAYINTADSLYILWLLYAAFVLTAIFLLKEKVKAMPVITMLVLAFYLVYVYDQSPIYSPRQPQTLRAAVLDVGQGQCIFVSTPNHNIIIDCGSTSYNAKAGERALSYLDQNLIDTIDVMFVSHYHADHVNGLFDVINAKNVKNIILLPIDDPNGVREQILKLCKNNGINVVDIDGDYKISMGEDCDAVVYGSQINNGKVTNDQNENNLVLSLRYRYSKFLFTGDIDTAAQKYLCQNADLDSDVLVVPHHGSKGSFNYDFLSAVSAPVSLISVGKDNSYGLPSQEVISTLKSEGSQVFETDLNKTIIVDTNGDGNFKIQYQ